MKKKPSILIYLLLLMGVVLIIASGCKKEDEPTPNPPSPSPYGNITDNRDGNQYITVKIGNQIWMAENLKYLPSVVGPEVTSLTVPNFYVHGYNGNDVAAAKATDNYAIYGVLYNWAAVMNGQESSNANPSGIQGICPDGWHLPSHAEWEQLVDYLNPSFAGGKLKEAGTAHWNSPNHGATNETGFSALPGGWRTDQAGGSFGNLNDRGFWWSSTEGSGSGAIGPHMDYQYSTVVMFNQGKAAGFSCRCVKN